MPTAQPQITLDAQTRKNLDQWLNGDYDQVTKDEIKQMMQTNPKEVIDAFYTNLDFGTGGLRGIMGPGSNRMNVYTVRAATQGLAQYLHLENKSKKELSALIGYDSRKHSREFAEEAAKVLAGNNIKVYLYSDIRPTPLVSFGCRFKKCDAAIMITASHNPPEYNGYKVYWSDGGQVVPPHDTGIIAEVNKITEPSMVKSVSSIKNPLIQEKGILEEVDEAYFKVIMPLQNYPKENKNFGHVLKYVYTSLHGTGITMVPRALQEWGFNPPILVEKQVIPDGSFPTVNYPNPEEPEALKLGIKLMEEKNADVLIATDPDADRLGVAVRHRGKSVILTGNQVACICIEHICRALSEQKRLPLNAAFIKSIVTSELFKAIAEGYQRKCVEELIGFKYIANQIHLWDKDPKGYQYIFGAEESLGYLLGSKGSRDKDAVSASALLCEVALHAKIKGKTLVDLLNDIYDKYGVYIEKLVSVKFEETKEGRDQMVKGMVNLRENEPKEILGIPVVSVDDYQEGMHKVLKTGKTTQLTLPKSNILTFWLEDGSKVTVRPSGTEPKIKLYAGTMEKAFENLDKALESSKKKADDLLQAVEKLLKS